MIEIDVQQIPNQEFIRKIDDDSYTIRFRTFKDMLLADISRNEEVLSNSVKVCQNRPIIPYEYLTKGGNFVFVCLDDEYPHYTHFGVTQQLVYMTNEELAEFLGK